MTQRATDDTSGPVEAPERWDPEFAGGTGCCRGPGPDCMGRPDQMVVSQVLAKFERSRKIAYFTHGQLDLEAGDRVVVETDRGTGVARIITRPRRQFANRRSLRRILKRIPETDPASAGRRKERERQAFDVGTSRIAQRRLPMRIVGVEYVTDDTKVIFYFCAEGRVDFRELVRDLARELRTRIEMRQIGVRDQAKMVGGTGICGRELCCSSFLRSFEPVTIKMAKIQGLVLNPQKVSGQCGRLLCCLSYEHGQYKEARRGLPKVGTRVRTTDGLGRVRELDILGRRVRVHLEDNNIVSCAASELLPLDASPPDKAPANAARGSTRAAEDGRADGRSHGTGGAKRGGTPRAAGAGAAEKPRKRRRRRGGRVTRARQVAETTQETTAREVPGGRGKKRGDDAARDLKNGGTKQSGRRRKRGRRRGRRSGTQKGGLRGDGAKPPEGPQK